MTLSDIPFSFDYGVHMLHGLYMFIYLIDFYCLLFFSHTCLETWARLLNGVHIVQSFKGLIGFTFLPRITASHPEQKNQKNTQRWQIPIFSKWGGWFHEIQQLKKVHEGNALIMLLLLLLFVLLDMFLLWPGFLRKIAFSQVDGELNLEYTVPSRCLRSLPIPQLI